MLSSRPAQNSQYARSRPDNRNPQVVFLDVETLLSTGDRASVIPVELLAKDGVEEVGTQRLSWLWIVNLKCRSST